MHFVYLQMWKPIGLFEWRMLWEVTVVQHMSWMWISWIRSQLMMLFVSWTECSPQPTVTSSEDQKIITQFQIDRSTSSLLTMLKTVWGNTNSSYRVRNWVPWTWKFLSMSSCSVRDKVLFIVKHDFSKHTYNDFMFTMKSYHFP